MSAQSSRLEFFGFYNGSHSHSSREVISASYYTNPLDCISGMETRDKNQSFGGGLK